MKTITGVTRSFRIFNLVNLQFLANANFSNTSSSEGRNKNSEMESSMLKNKNGVEKKMQENWKKIEMKMQKGMRVHLNYPSTSGYI